MLKTKTAARVAAVVASGLVLVACATPDVDVAPVATPAPEQGGTAVETTPGTVAQTVSVAWATAPNSRNTLTAHGNSSHNATINYLTLGPGFAFFDQNMNFVRNTDFGTFSAPDTAFNEDGSLTVTFTINDGVTWSDGVPVDAADMLLTWAAMNDRYDTISEEAYAEQYDDGAIALPSDQVYFSSGTPGITDVTEFPTISDDGRSITFTYNNPRADWEFQFAAPAVPAHTVARLALGIDDAEAGKQALITALGGPADFRAQTGTETPNVTNTFGPAGAITTFVEPNLAEVAEIADTWNTGFDFSTLPSDPGILLSYGPFVIAEIQEGQFVRVERNPYFVAGSVVTLPHMDEITVRFIQNDLAQATALQNREVDIISPDVTQDLLTTLEGIPGITIDDTEEAVWEHITLQLTNGGPFDPAHWGGNEDQARAVRQAFFLTVPRQQIMDLIINPTSPAATVRNSTLFIPGAPGYDQVVANNGSDFFGLDQAANNALAREILVDAGLEGDLPIDVRLLYGTQNARRVQQFPLIQASAPDLFNVIDEGDEAWGPRVFNNPGSYDAALFGWQGTSTAFLNAEANTITGGNNNLGGFSNARVDELWAEAQQETDPARIIEIASEMETILNEEAIVLPLFQHPGVLAYADDLEGVSTMPLSPMMFWNFWNWQRVAG